MTRAAANPPSPFSRRRFRLPLRFSLRTFLAAITIFCVVFGWRINRARLQRDAVTTIRAAGGTVLYDYQWDFGPEYRYRYKRDAAATPWEAAWLLATLGIDFFHDVTWVSTAPRGDKEKLPLNLAPHLARFPRLRCLQVHGDLGGDDVLRSAGSLASLECLSILHTTISDEGVAHLGSLSRLRFVELHASQFGDGSLATLARLPNLERLSVPGNYTDGGLAVLAAHPKLERLDLSGPRKLNSITDAGLVHLSQLPRLETLELGLTRVTPTGLKQLQKLPKLRSLFLDHSTADDHAAVAPLFPKCQIYCTTAESPFSRLPSSLQVSADP